MQVPAPLKSGGFIVSGYVSQTTEPTLRGESLGPQARSLDAVTTNCPKPKLDVYRQEVLKCHQYFIQTRFWPEWKEWFYCYPDVMDQCY